jgi:hypothetical protein
MSTWAEIWSTGYAEWSDLIRLLDWSDFLLAVTYLAAAWMCVVCAVLAHDELGDDWGWRVAVVVLVVLAGNTLLKLDQLLLLTLRAWSHVDGWYEDRRLLQYALVAVALCLGLGTLGWLRTRLSHLWPYCGQVVLGVCLLIGLTILRAVSFHETDALLQLDLMGLSMSNVLELLGLGLVLNGTYTWRQMF